MFQGHDHMARACLASGADGARASPIVTHTPIYHVSNMTYLGKSYGDTYTNLPCQHLFNKK